MPELAALLKAKRAVDVHPTCLSKLLRAAGFTYKKPLLASKRSSPRRYNPATLSFSTT
jgi:transposase